MLRRHVVCVILAVIAAACSTDKVMQPVVPSVMPPVASIVDGSVPGGLEGFYFRSPLNNGKPAGTGVFDGSLLDLLAMLPSKSVS